MKNRILFLLVLCFPLLGFADNTITFRPPTSDYSVGWLSAIFGIVDGVLAGTGSQILGRMFEIFNASVMALGGIIITYTMIVSTMNTAHEGEMLGKKWSSIWVPIRATAGFSLLIPKASGYCLLQIFVMWVIVQGVGAADKLWDAALNYLNKGGVIIQTEQNPLSNITKDPAAENLTQGAMTILAGQVCMLALEKVLNNRLTTYLNAKNKGSGPCIAATGNMKEFCESGSVPSLNESIDLMTPSQDLAQQQVAAYSAYFTSTAYQNYLKALANYNQEMYKKTHAVGTIMSSGGDFSSPLQPLVGAPQRPTPPTFTVPSTITPVPMPNFSASSQPFYAQLNGICGSISWNGISASDIQTLGSMNAEGPHSTQSIDQTTLQARGIAVQQLYDSLLLIARVMVNNDPNPYFKTPTASTSSQSTVLNPMQAMMSAAANTTGTQTTTTRASQAWATQPYGYPLVPGGTTWCSNSGQPCYNWGVIGGGSALFTGTELQSAMSEYINTMKPTLTLLQESGEVASYQRATRFIADAKASGWIMAGAYFFDLITLNNLNKAASKNTHADSDSGLQNSTFTLKNIIDSFPTTPGGSCNLSSTGSTKGVTTYPVLCEILNQNAESINPILSLMSGTVIPSPEPSHILTEATTFGTVLSNIKTKPIPSTQGVNDSTVYGYMQNAMVIQLPGTPPTPPLQFADMMHVKFEDSNFIMPTATFPCMGINLVLFKICIGRIIGDIVYNGIIVLVINTLSAWLLQFIYGFIMNMLMIPLAAMASIFTMGIKILDVQGINPIVALASMGTYYINFVGKLWFIMLIDQVIDMVLSLFGIVLLPVMVMAMPITIALSLVMLGVGFITAYYIPLVPYMIFLFGALAWFMAVIEAMVAAPIVALGVIHPEGHDLFGKGESAIMILMNVFLRPSMMIIGYIAGISLSYVGIWLLNAGFDRAIDFMQPLPHKADPISTPSENPIYQNYYKRFHDDSSGNIPGASAVSGGYTEWAGVFAFFFSIIIYTTIYMTLVEKAFSLISTLPDKVLRWIGGQPESHGQEAAQWMGEAKKGVEGASQKSGDAMVQAGKGVYSALEGPESGSVDTSQNPPGGGKPPA